MQSLKVNNSGKPLDNQTWHTNNWLQQNRRHFGFRADTTALWPIEQSSILFAKFDCPVAHLNLPLLATVHACETVLLSSVPEDVLLRFEFFLQLNLSRETNSPAPVGHLK